MGTGTPLLFYDGTCGFCARSVRFVLRHEGRRRDLRFARLEGDTGKELLTRHSDLGAVDSVIWYEPASSGHAERVLVRYRAALEVGEYLGGGWARLSALGRIVPRVLGDAVYDFVARHRHRIAGGDACVIPTPEQRARFLDPT